VCLAFHGQDENRVQIEKIGWMFSSPDETLRRELKKWCVVEYFWRTSRCFIWWWNTVSNAWYYFSKKIILEGEIKDIKWAVFHLISKHSLNFNFPCIFFMNNKMSLKILTLKLSKMPYNHHAVLLLWYNYLISFFYSSSMTKGDWRRSRH